MKTKFILLLFILMPFIGYSQTNQVELSDSIWCEMFNKANNDSIYYATIIELNNERKNALSNGNKEMLDTIQAKFNLITYFRDIHTKPVDNRYNPKLMQIRERRWKHFLRTLH